MVSNLCLFLIDSDTSVAASTIIVGGMAAVVLILIVIVAALVIRKRKPPESRNQGGKEIGWENFGREINEHPLGTHKQNSISA